MKTKWFILVCLTIATTWLYGQNAPITSAPVVGNAVNGQSVTAPITVKNFTDIGALTLTLEYQNSVMTFQSASFDAAFSGLTVNSSTPGRIVISWMGATGITLPDETQLIKITFHFISGSTALTWNTSGTFCQYKKYAGGAYTILSDTPKSSFYLNGFVATKLAPVTYAPVITNAVAGTIYFSVTIKNFSTISSLYLMMTYDINTLVYKNSFTPNPGLGGDFQVGVQPGPTGKNFLILSWYGNPATLPDGSTLITLKFNYSNTAGNGNYSALSWYECGPCCEYTDELSNVLYDSPTTTFYQDGLVTSQVSPVTSLPKISNAIPGSTITVPVKVTGFTNIGSLSLTFKYDPAVMTFAPGAYTPNPILGSSLVVTNTAPGPDGKRLIVIGWTGTPKTLPPDSSIVKIYFQYGSGTSQLTWRTTGDSCKYKDGSSNALWKSPASQYFTDGYAASHVAPTTKAEISAGISGQSLIVPVVVNNFTNIGGFNLTLDYDPGVLQFLSASETSGLGGTFTVTPSGLGQLVLHWNGPAGSLPDGTVLLQLAFTYNGGSATMQWHTDGSSCLFNEGSTMAALFDQPKADFYSNGMIVSGKYFNLSVLLEGPYSGSWTMSKAQDEFGDHFPGTTADEITVELHKPSNYAIIDYRALKTKLSTTGTAAVVVPGTFTKYWYATVKHRNSIETVTADSVSFSGGSTSYIFNVPSKAYGNNLTQMIDGAFTIFSGDTNQDGIVDGSDISEIGNLADYGATGYLPEDLNGDGLVDGTDISIVGNNADAGIGILTP